MNKQKERSIRIFSNLKISKLPSHIKEDNYSELGKEILEFLNFVSREHNKSIALKWCFLNIKRTKIFLQIFTANEENREIYKEEIFGPNYQSILIKLLLKLSTKVLIKVIM